MSASGPAYTITHGSCWNIGRRQVMEDVHHLVDDVSAAHGLKCNWHPHAYYAIFDGHAGIWTARYARENLLKNVATHPQYLTAPQVAIKEGHAKTDDDFQKVWTDSRKKDSGDKAGFSGGCTSMSIFFHGDKLICANLGDSRSVASINKKAVPLSVDQKPWRKDETERIQEAGGHVVFNRVNGILGVARALGDFEFKVGCFAEKPLISHDPELHVQPVAGIEFIIMACDGLWDVVSNQLAVDIVHQVIQKKKEEGKGLFAGLKKLVGKPPDAAKCVAQAASEALVTYALQKDSQDNVSVFILIITHKHGGGTDQHSGSASGSPGRGVKGSPGTP